MPFNIILIVCYLTSSHQYISYSHDDNNFTDSKPVGYYGVGYSFIHIFLEIINKIQNIREQFDLLPTPVKLKSKFHSKIIKTPYNCKIMHLSNYKTSINLESTISYICISFLFFLIRMLSLIGSNYNSEQEVIPQSVVTNTLQHVNNSE